MNWPVFIGCMAFLLAWVLLYPRLIIGACHFLAWASKTSDKTKRTWETIATVIAFLLTSYILMKCWEYL